LKILRNIYKYELLLINKLIINKLINKGVFMIKKILSNSGDLVSIDDIIVTRIKDSATIILKLKNKNPKENGTLAAIATISNSNQIDSCLKPLIKRLLANSYSSDISAKIFANSDLNLIEDMEDYLSRYNIDLDEIKLFEEQGALIYSIKKGEQFYSKRYDRN